jgi:hypothetical protein
MMATVKVACPFCGKIYRVAEEQLQKRTTCRECEQGFLLADAVVQEPPGSASASAEAQWYVEINGTQRGPFARDKVITLFEAGRINGGSLVWREGMGTWQPLKSVTEFAPVVPRKTFSDVRQAPERGAATLEDADDLRAVALPQAAGAAPQRRPAAFVFIVFYTAFSGILGVIGGWLLVQGSCIAGSLGNQLPFGASQMSVGAIFIELAGLIAFFLGFMILVIAYGLWSGQHWGIKFARIFYMIGAVISLITAVMSIRTGVGVLSSIFSLVVSLATLAYLYGTAELAHMTQRHVGRFLDAGRK